MFTTEPVLRASLSPRGNSLAFELRPLPRYISKQRLHRCLGRDHEAGESDRATYVLGGVSKLFFPKNVIVTFRGEGDSHVTFCLPTKCTVLQEKVGTIYNHPTTQYEQFIEWYCGRHKGSGKSKATVISDGQVWRTSGRGFQLNVTMTLFWKK